MWRAFEALPPYFGGKRRLCPRIFREIARVHPRETWSSLRLVDPFLGGGSVSLYAKAQGFGVICGDLAERSVIIGKALVENDSVRLDEPAEGNRHLIEQSYVPDCFALTSAQFLDNAFAVVEQVDDETKRSLLRLLLVKYIYWLRPHSKFSSPGAFNRPFADRRYDDIKATYKQSIAANATHPYDALTRLREDINRAVFRGAQRCAAERADARETILRTRGADVLYLDPPYAGTLSYEKEYALLDGLLGDHLESSAYSREEGLERLADLLSLCGEHRLWVISYGNAVACLDEVRDVIERFRPARAIELQYAHLGAVATREKTDANREFIILAGEGVS